MSAIDPHAPCRPARRYTTDELERIEQCIEAARTGPEFWPFGALTAQQLQGRRRLQHAMRRGDLARFTGEPR